MRQSRVAASPLPAVVLFVPTAKTDIEGQPRCSVTVSVSGQVEHDETATTSQSQQRATPTRSEIKLHKIMDESNDESSDEEECDSEPCDDKEEEGVQVYLDQVLNGYRLIDIAMPLNQSNCKLRQTIDRQQLSVPDTTASFVKPLTDSSFFRTVAFPIADSEETVSHPVRAWQTEG